MREAILGTNGARIGPKGNLHLNEQGVLEEGPLINQEREGVLYAKGSDNKWYTLDEFRESQISSHILSLHEHKKFPFNLENSGLRPIIFVFEDIYRSGDNFRGIEIAEYTWGHKFPLQEFFGRNLNCYLDN